MVWYYKGSNFFEKNKINQHKSENKNFYKGNGAKKLKTVQPAVCQGNLLPNI